MSDLEIIPLAVAAGQTLSAPAAIGVKTIVGISMPATWNSDPLTFRVSPTAA